MKQQSKMPSAGNHKSYENCNSYSLKQNEVKMDEPSFLGFSVLGLRKSHMYRT